MSIGSLTWIVKPGLAMYLGIATLIPYLLFLCGLFPFIDSIKNRVLNLGATISTFIGFFGTLALSLYGGTIAEVRGPLIYCIWAIISCLVATFVFFVVKGVIHLIRNGRSKGEVVEEVVQSSRLIAEKPRREQLDKLNTTLRESGQLRVQNQNPNRQGQSGQNPYHQGGQGGQNPYRQNPNGQGGQNPYRQNPNNPSSQGGQNPYRQNQNPYRQNPNNPNSQGGQNLYRQNQNLYRQGGQNPYRQNPQRPQRPQNPYGQNQNQGNGRNPYQQGGYGTGAIDVTGHSKKSGFIGKR